MHKIRLLGGLLALLAGIGGVVTADTTAEELEEDLSLTSRVVTPHVDWGQPSAQGIIRGLFFVFGGHYGPDWTECGTRYREVVELCQRFDIQPEGAIVDNAGGKWSFHGGKLGEDRAERLLAKPHDVIVIAGFGLDKLPTKMQYEILKQVVAGTGLVCIGPGNEYLLPKRRIQPTPESLWQGLPVLPGAKEGEWMQPSDYITAYRLGKGRGVWLNYQAHALSPFRPFSWRNLAEYDYRMLIVGRAVLWAAGKEGVVALGQILSPEKVQIKRQDKAPAGSVIVHSKRAMTATMRLSLRRAEDGLDIPLEPKTLALAENSTVSVPVILPRLRAGDYYLHVIIKSKTGVEAAGAKLLSVESPYGVEGVSLDKDYAEQGEQIAGVVRTRGTVPPRARLLLRRRDSYGRILELQELKRQASPNEYAFRIVASPFDTILMRAEACLQDEGGEVEIKTAEYTVPKRRQGQFNFVMWDGPNDVLGYYAWKQLQEVGYNICLIGSMGETPREQPSVLRACDTSLVPYSTRILDPKDENGYMKPVCWNHEPNVTQYVQKIVNNQVNLRKQGVFVYSLGDEGVTKGCCVHPSCLAAYRQWLKQQYGTIDKLNASWGENYKSFEEVDLRSPQDNMEVQAKKTCPPRWYDREAFARYNLARFAHRFADAYKQLDPHAITGFEGTGGFGDDYDAILSHIGFYGPYPSIGDDIIRSRAPRELIRSNWMGYSKTGDALSDAAWRMIMKGLDSCWYWMWDGIGSFRGVLSPTIDYFPCTADFLQEMKPVREGLGDLLLHSQWIHSGIGILYSLPSALSGGVEDSGTYQPPQQATEAWLQMTYELGQDARFLTSDMLAQGRLTNSEFKVLCLPMCQALKPEEAQIIRQFVQNGGTLIADVRPAIFDGHMKAVMPGLLDDVFGIQRIGRGKAQAAEITLQGHLGNAKLDLKLQTKIDPDIRLQGGTALASINETPVLIFHRVGQGQAILLNFSLLAMRDEKDEQGRQMRALLGALYRVAKTQLPVGVSSPQGEPLFATETRVWRNGESLIFGVWRQMRNAWFAPKAGTKAGEPVPARLTLPQSYHVYDLRHGKYLGTPRSWETKLRWGRPNFYLATPYPIKGLKITVKEPQPRRGQIVTATISLPVPASAQLRHAVYIQLFTPTGEQPLWGRYVRILQGGRAQVQLPIAYNDPAGIWRLRATELFSRQSAEATWKLP